MELTLIGVADMRASIDIDDDPFVRSAILSLPQEAELAPSQAFRPHLPRGLLGSVAGALGANVADLDYSIPEIPFSTWPLVGRGLEFRLGPGAAPVTRLREAAIKLLDVNYPNISLSIDVQLDPTNPTVTSLQFNKYRLRSIIRSADVHLAIKVYSVGFIVARLKIYSADAEFSTYWYPVYGILEAASYHEQNIRAMFPENQRAALPAGLGSFNAALAAFRTTICRYYLPAVERETSRRQLDEVEAGFEPVVRMRADERWQDGLAIAKSTNGSGGMTSILTNRRDAYIGWAAIFYVERADYDDEKPSFNAELCVLIYSLFFFYERFLSEFLASHIFSGKPIPAKSDVDAQRRFGDAIFYLADLQRASNAGSDLAFYEAWSRVSKLDALRKKTSDGLNAVVDRLDERAKRRTELWAGRLALITGAIGLTSLLELLNGLREYLKEPENGGHPVPTLLQLKFLSPSGYDIFGAYILVACILLFVWLYTRGFERK